MSSRANIAGPEHVDVSAAHDGQRSETVTACLIVQNERERIGEALESVAFCDEIVVVDGGSDDGTVELAEGLGARVIRNPWPGFAKQRNVAIDAATSDWILEVDADERVSPRLRDEIRDFLASSSRDFEMAVIPLRDTFLGKTLGPSANYPMYRNRLFRRGAYRHDESLVVHEGLWARGSVPPFESDLTHIFASSWREALGDCVRYARLQARHVPRPGPLRLGADVVLRPTFKLVYRLSVLGGWRDGLAGVARVGIECASDALTTVFALRQSGDVVPREGAPRVGPLRIVGLAAGAESAARGATWLEQAAGDGADVALVAPAAPASARVRVRPLGRFGPLRAIRALEAEAQVRAIDALVPLDTPSAVLTRLLRTRLRKLVRRVDLGAPATETFPEIGSRTRDPGAVTAATAR